MSQDLETTLEESPIKENKALEKMIKRSQYKKFKTKTKNKKIDMASIWVPMYQLSQLRTPGAIIIHGKQLFFRKLPKNRDYYIDKDLGLFEINPDKAFFYNKVPIFFYDTRNQNAIDLGTLNDLWKWAEMQGLYKIKRSDVKHAVKIRTMMKPLSKINSIEEYEIERKKALTRIEEQEGKRHTETQKLINQVQADIEKKNLATEQKKIQETGSASSTTGEYHKISELDAQFIIINNMFLQGHIDKNQKLILNHKLTTHEISTPDELIAELQSFSQVLVTQPISLELERILDDYHTYKPKDILFIIKELAKLYKGFKNLRTKPIINWFPSMYVLFGIVGAGIFVYLLYQAGIFSGTPTP